MLINILAQLRNCLTRQRIVWCLWLI